MRTDPTTAVSTKAPLITTSGTVIARAQCRVADSQSCASIDDWREDKEDWHRKGVRRDLRSGLVGTHLELNDLLDAVICLPDPAHLLIESTHAPTDAFCCPRCGRHFVGERKRIDMEFFYSWKEGLEARK